MSTRREFWQTAFGPFVVARRVIRGERIQPPEAVGTIVWGALLFAGCNSTSDSMPVPAAAVAPHNPNLLPVPQDIPRAFVASAQEAKALGKFQTLHGGTAATVIAKDLVYDSTNADKLSGIYSFKALWYMDVPEVAWARNKLYKTRSPFPKMTESTELWVAASRPDRDVDLQVWRETKVHANYTAGTRAFSPIVNERVVQSLWERVNTLKQQVESGQTTADTRGLYQKLSDELELQERRLVIWQRMSAAEKELATTPAVFDWHLDKADIGQPAGLRVKVKDGYLPFSRLKRVYVPRTISSSAEQRLTQALKGFNANAVIEKVEADVLIKSENTVVPRMQQFIDKTSVALDYLPLIGFVAIAASPVGVGIMDLSSTMDMHDMLQESGRTNFTFQEYTAAFNHYDQIAKWTGFDFIPNAGEGGVDRSWVKMNLQMNNPYTASLELKDGQEVYQEIGKSEIAGISGRYYRFNFIEGDKVVIPDVKITYIGKENNTPRISIEYSGQTFYKDLYTPEHRDLGPHLGPTDGIEQYCFQVEGFNQYASVFFVLRYIENSPEYMELYIKPVVIEANSCPP